MSFFHLLNEGAIAIMRDGKIVQTAAPERMSTAPADEYVEQFIQSTDKSLVLTAKHVMITPSCMIRHKDNIGDAVRLMRKKESTSAYIVDAQEKLVGVLLLDDTLSAEINGGDMADKVLRDLITTTEETLLSHLLPVVAETRYPIPVLDENGVLNGIVSKASALKALV